MEQQTGSKSGKQYVKAVYCHPAYLTYMQSTSWEILVWMKHKLECADNTTLMAESEELKSLLMKVKEESEKVSLKLNIQKTRIMASSPINSRQIDSGNCDRLYFCGLQSHSRWWPQEKTLAPWKKNYDQPSQHIKKQRHYFANKGPSSQSYGFSSGHVWMLELNYKERLAATNLCFWTVVLEKSLESALDFKEIQPVHSKGNQSWLFIGRTEGETPILWPPEAKNWLI